jgi:ATP-dependent Lon protease
LDLFFRVTLERLFQRYFDLKRAEKILDQDHFEEVKKRMIEHLAVLKLRNDEVTNYV